MYSWYIFVVLASTPVMMPALSPTMTEGTIVKWHKKEGNYKFNQTLMYKTEVYIRQLKNSSRGRLL